MSEQGNDVDDPAAILADYDFSKSSGASKDTGEVKTEDWPSGVDKDDFNPSGLKVVPKWINSQYTEPTRENIKEFAKTFDGSPVEATVRINVLKANQNKLRKGHLKDSERACIAILAYEGTGDLGDLAEKYPLSRESFRRAKYAFDKIIEVQSGNVSKDGLEREIERYINSTPHAISKGMQEKHKSKEKEPRTGGGDRVAESEMAGEQNTSEMITVELELDRSTAKQAVLNDELPNAVSEEIVESILESVGL